MAKSQASTTEAPSSTLADRLASEADPTASPRVQAAIALDNAIKAEKEAFLKYQEAAKLFHSIKGELSVAQENRKRAQQLVNNLINQGATPNLDMSK